MSRCARVALRIHARRKAAAARLDTAAVRAYREWARSTGLTPLRVVLEHIVQRAGVKMDRAV